MNKAKVSKAKVSKAKVSKAKVSKAKVSDEQKLARLVEEVIDKGADTAEEIHRAILDLPIVVLESLGLEGTAAGVKKVQDASIGAIYDLLHDINHNVADLAKDLLKQRKGKKK